MRLDRQTVCWDNIGLGLQQVPGSSVYAKLYAESFETISTQSRQTTACTIPKSPIQYGANKQYATQESKAPLLDKNAKRFIQQVCSKFLFLGRAVDSTLFPNQRHSIITIQTNWRHNATTLQLLDYLATQEDAVLSYHASDMSVHSNAGYLSKPKAQSWVGGHFFLSSNTTVPPNNGAILSMAHIIKNFMSSTIKAELAGLYIMARKAINIRIILVELDHVQPPTPLQTDNAMADRVSGWSH